MTEPIFISTFRKVLLLSLLFLVATPTPPLYSVNVIKQKSETNILTKRAQKKSIKTHKKVGRKVDKLQKKLEELRAMNEVESKGKGLAIAGGIVLLIGLILIFAGSNRSNRGSSSIGGDIDNAAYGCATVFGGLLLSVVGVVLLIVGLVLAIT